MKIITWNVNSIRQRLARVKALLERHEPDVLCLQEIKVEEGAFPAAELSELGYEAAVFGQRGYNGVATLARREPGGVERGFPGDPVPGEARVLAATVGDLRVVNLYAVNGRSVDSPKYEVKLRWLGALGRWLEDSADPGEPLLLVGDFNIAPADRDVHDPERWRGKVLCSEAERQGLERLLGWGLVDLLRHHTEEGGLYTWWDYRFGAFHRGWGLRIDLALGTEAVADRLREVSIDRDERKPTAGEGKPSDHAPLVVTLGS